MGTLAAVEMPCPVGSGVGVCYVAPLVICGDCGNYGVMNVFKPTIGARDNL
jgi:hypothetical protein